MHNFFYNFWCDIEVNLLRRPMIYYYLMNFSLSYYFIGKFDFQYKF
jgi:hypothetical protein